MPLPMQVAKKAKYIHLVKLQCPMGGGSLGGDVAYNVEKFLRNMFLKIIHSPKSYKNFNLGTQRSVVVHWNEHPH